MFFSNATKDLPKTHLPVSTTEEPPVSTEVEHEKSMEIFFMLLVVGMIKQFQTYFFIKIQHKLNNPSSVFLYLGLCIFVIFSLIKHNFKYLPESVAVVFLGSIIYLLAHLICQTVSKNVL